MGDGYDQRIATDSQIAVQDAYGHWLEKVAGGPPEAGRNFWIVWARWEDGRDFTPWPLENVALLADLSEESWDHSRYLAWLLDESDPWVRERGEQ